MPIPEFRPDGWLPEGHHPATWDEIETCFGGAPASRRAAVLSGLLQWRDAVRAKGMGGLIILGGSFISHKDAPGDFDCIFVYNRFSFQTVSQDPEALALLDNAHCKGRYCGDVWAFSEEAVHEFPAFCRTDGFDLHKLTRQPKGVVEVDL